MFIPNVFRRDVICKDTVLLHVALPGFQASSKTYREYLGWATIVKAMSQPFLRVAWWFIYFNF